MFARFASGIVAREQYESGGRSGTCVIHAQLRIRRLVDNSRYGEIDRRRRCRRRRNRESVPYDIPSRYTWVAARGMPAVTSAVGRQR